MVGSQAGSSVGVEASFSTSAITSGTNEYRSRTVWDTQRWMMDPTGSAPVWSASLPVKMYDSTVRPVALWFRVLREGDSGRHEDVEPIEWERNRGHARRGRCSRRRNPRADEPTKCDVPHSGRTASASRQYRTATRPSGTARHPFGLLTHLRSRHDRRLSTQSVLPLPPRSGTSPFRR